MGKHCETFTREKVKNLKDIEVGVLFAPEIHFRLNGRFRHEGEYYSGAYTAMRRDGKILLKGEGKEEIVADGFTLTPEQFEEADFDLPNVTIGIHFHWERQETQKFKQRSNILIEKFGTATSRPCFLPKIHLPRRMQKADEDRRLWSE